MRTLKVKNDGMGIRHSTRGKADKYLIKVSRKMVMVEVHLRPLRRSMCSRMIRKQDVSVWIGVM